MRYNDTVNHQLSTGGVSIVRACNVTGSAVTVRIFNVPDADQKTMNISGVDADNAAVYGLSIPANETYDFNVDARFPVIVYQATANAINWSTR